MTEVAAAGGEIRIRLFRFTLYSRSYCHLCEQMLEALTLLLSSEEIEVAVVDVDNDTALVDLYDELVPVLIGHSAEGTTTRLCHYFLDVEKVRAFCFQVPALHANPNQV